MIRERPGPKRPGGTSALRRAAGREGEICRSSCSWTRSSLRRRRVEPAIRLLYEHRAGDHQVSTATVRCWLLGLLVAAGWCGIDVPAQACTRRSRGSRRCGLRSAWASRVSAGAAGAGLALGHVIVWMIHQVYPHERSGRSDWPRSRPLATMNVLPRNDGVDGRAGAILRPVAAIAGRPARLRRSASSAGTWYVTRVRAEWPAGRPAPALGLGERRDKDADLSLAAFAEAGIDDGAGRRRQREGRPGR